MRRALRASSGLSAAELAGMIGVTRQAMSKYERGLRTPRGQLLEAYIAVLQELAAPSASGGPSEALLGSAVDHGLIETAGAIKRDS
jgi:transcriptional regulator with XRE-family HTH domain